MFSKYNIVMALLLSTSFFVTYSSQDGNFGGFDDFDDLLDYVNNYINFTTQYTLNEDNSDLTNTTNTTVYDYGTFDFIIVGGGSAGSLLANRLSVNTNWTVLLIEAGNVTNPFTDIPFMNFYTFYSPFNWGYKTVPQENSCQGMEDQRCVYPTGKGLGGSAIIGHSVYARGHTADFDELAAAGLEGWSYDDLLPYFKKSETIQIDSYDAGYHGHSGELYVNYTEPNPINFDYCLEAAKEAGLKYVDYNGENQLGISKFQWIIDFNTKLTGGNAFILPILNTTTNLNLTLNSYATKILFSNTTATGVQFIKNGTIYTATASKEVILSAGAINSPQLLMLSGVGPKEDLEALDIDVVKDLPVGKYLADHPVFVGLYIRTNLTADAGNVSYNLEGWTEGLGYYTTTFSAENIQFINTKQPGVEPPNVEVLTINNPTSVPAGTFYNLNENYTEVFANYNTLTDFLVYTIVLKPKSRGYVKLNSTSATEFPLINPAYFTDSGDEDILVMYEAIQYVLNLTKTESLQAINATLVAEAPDCEYLKTDSEEAYWYCAIRSLTSTLYHPGSTTRMGVNPTNSVTDAKLKVHGMSNLRVVDHGSFPNMIRGHPLAAIFAMAEKAADLIKDEYSN